MKKEDAIKYLQQLYPYGGHCWLDEQRIEAIGMAVKALQEEPVSEELEKIVEEIAEPTILNAYGTKELARRLRNTICGTSVSEDLEEASKNYALNNTPWDDCKDEIQESFKAGAQWQKEKNESTTEDLGEYINELSKQFPEVSFAKLSRIAVRVAKWQKQQDQSTIELAEDHAMLAGMEKMKEQMMAKTKSGTVQKDNQVILDDGTYIDLDPSMQLKPSFVGLKEGDRIKVIVIKED